MFKSLLAKLAVRQMTALTSIPALFSKMPALLFSGKIKSFLVAFLAVFQLLGVVLFDYPGPVLGEEINLGDYTLVFSEEFRDESLNTEVWQTISELGTGEIYDDSMISFDGENMIISTEYLENGSKGAGWYTCGIENTEAYSNFGPGCYYECRCKAPAAKGMWSAFWMMTEGQRRWDNGERGTHTEIDVMESFYYGEKYQNSTLHTLHSWRNQTADYESVIVGKYRVDKDMYNDYVTYGVLWLEDEFIFYIDGRESGRSSVGATKDSAFMLLTCQVRTNGFVHPAVLDNPEGTFPAKFVVDYVRVYGNVDKT